MPKGRGGHHKHAVLTLVERGGSARSFHVDGISTADFKSFIVGSVAPETALTADELVAYKPIGKGFASHDSVNHSKDEYVRGHVHTNTVRGYYSVFNRGMKGVFQHCGERHLHCYLIEFVFRYSHRAKLGYDDTHRALIAMKGAGGKRLTYKQPRPTQPA